MPIIEDGVCYLLISEMLKPCQRVDRPPGSGLKAVPEADPGHELGGNPDDSSGSFGERTGPSPLLAPGALDEAET